MRKWTLTALLAAMTVLFGCSAVSRKQAAGSERRADIAMRDGRYDEAQQEYSQALAKRPSGSSALKRAYCLGKLGNTEESRQALEEAVRLGVKEAEPILTSRTEGGSGELSSLAEEQPRSTAAQTALGEALFREGAFEESAKAFQRALGMASSQEPRTAILYNLTLANLRAGRYAAAAASFEKYANTRGGALTTEESMIMGAVRYANGDEKGAAAAWSHLPERERLTIQSVIGEAGGRLAALGR